MKYLTKNYEETQKLGEEFSKHLKGGDVILLHGDLGGGKTTFVQGLAKGLGVKRRIISPTFIIMRSHKIDKGEVKDFYHLDLYRIKSKDDVDGLGLDEIIGNKESIVAIEWPERLYDVRDDAIRIYFENEGENERSIEINGRDF